MRAPTRLRAGSARQRRGATDAYTSEVVNCSVSGTQVTGHIFCVFDGHGSQGDKASGSRGRAGARGAERSVQVAQWLSARFPSRFRDELSKQRGVRREHITQAFISTFT